MLTKSRQNWLSDLGWLSIIFLLFYALWLGSYPLFTPDEGRYSSVAREMLFSHDFITPRLNGIQFLDKPILYYWLQAIAMTLFGVNEWALRFFPMLIGVINCLAVYVCTRLIINRRAGMLSAVILATMPLYFSGAHYANLDLEVAAFVSMTLLFFLTAIKTERIPFFFVSYGCSALAFMTKGLIGIAFPTLIIGSWIALTNQWALLKRVYLPQGILLFLLLVSPWYIFAQQANPDFFHFFFVTQQITRFLSSGSFNNENAFWFYLPVILVGTFPWSIYLLQSVYHAFKKRTPELLYLLVWFVIILIFFSIPQSKTVGYILSLFPATAIMIGIYLDHIWEHDHLRSDIPQRAFIAISVILGILFIYLFFKPNFHLAQKIKPFFILYSLIFILASIAAYNAKRFSTFILVCLCTSGIFLLALTYSGNALNQTTAKPLLTDLYRLRKPTDEIVNYYKFYQDLPVYLGERVTLVANWESPSILDRDNWVRELWFGRLAQHNYPTLIGDAEFLTRWNSDKRLFVFVNANYFRQFQLAVKNYYLIRRYNDIFLVSNKPQAIG